MPLHIFLEIHFKQLLLVMQELEKTTLLTYLRKEILRQYPKLSIAFVTYTGKASSVLKTKLEINNAFLYNDYVGTIHGLIYKPKTVWDKKLKCHVVVDWELKSEDELYYDLVIIDEGSMVSEAIWNDLNRLCKSIIVMGDHGQLPPIGDKFNLMENPHFKLKIIHRQALNSPIIALSKFIREHGYIPSNRIFSKEVFKLSWKDPKCKKLWNNNVVFDDSLIVLCAFNTTRCQLNREIRKKLSFDSEKLPMPGERIICLQNDHKRGIMNGQIATMMWIMPESYKLYRMTLSVDGIVDPIEATVSDSCFDQVYYTMYEKTAQTKKQYEYAIFQGISPIDYFDYGYATSVHKSQGSEWEKVILFEQRTKKWDDEYYAKWLYTGVTRSRSKLFIIEDYWG